jgi:lysophospholipase L1-like esterase
MKKLLLLLAGLIFGLLLAEAGLRLYSFLAPRRSNILSRAWTPITIEDSRLGIRPNPKYPEHDEKGFRNGSVPKEAFVVAMGDSHTYGTGVRRNQNWPSQLSESTGRTVYSIASGGWGPTQSLLLFDEALALHPKLIVEAMYDGNDLYDSFANVYYDHQLADTKTADTAAAAAIREAEAKEALNVRFSKIFRGQQGLEEGPSPNETPSAGARAKEFLREHSRVYRLTAVLFRSATRRMRQSKWESAAAHAKSGPTYEQPFQAGAVRTVFTPAYRLFAMDLDDPRIAEGLRISLESIRRMKERADRAGVPFLVLLLPTKELAFQSAAAGTAADAGDYRKCIEKEMRARERTVEFLKAAGIAFIDPVPALQASLARGVPPYPTSSDGHPNPDGYRVIAGLVGDEMAKRGLSRTAP